MAHKYIASNVPSTDANDMHIPIARKLAACSITQGPATLNDLSQMSLGPWRNIDGWTDGRSVMPPSRMVP